jgi:hypothetical protein
MATKEFAVFDGDTHVVERRPRWAQRVRMAPLAVRQHR